MKKTTTKEIDPYTYDPRKDTRSNRILYISHRGNMDGDCGAENSPKQIDLVISKGFMVEVDLRMKGKTPYLGHDDATYRISESWLRDRELNLYVHAKTRDALAWLQNTDLSLSWFYHEQDPYTLVSDGSIWTHNLHEKPLPNSILPLLCVNQLRWYHDNHHFGKKSIPFEGICTDHIYEAVRLFGGDR
jgi:hypothetical protein